MTAANTIITAATASDARPPTIIDYKELHSLTLKATKDYSHHRNWETGDQYGLWHGSTGKLRAKNTLSFLENDIGTQNHEGLVAMLLAIFGEPPKGVFNWVFGRSSMLAGMIANRLITGNHETIVDHVFGTGITADYSLGSKVFSRASINIVESNRDNFGSIPGEYGGASYLDKTKAMRQLLQLALQDFSSAKRSEIKEYSDKIKTALSKAEEPQPTKISNLRTHAATVGFFHDEVFDANKKLLRKIPADCCENIAEFLDEKDGARLMLARRSAAQSVYSVFQSVLKEANAEESKTTFHESHNCSMSALTSSASKSITS